MIAMLSISKIYFFERVISLAPYVLGTALVVAAFFLGRLSVIRQCNQLLKQATDAIEATIEKIKKQPEEKK